MIRRHGLEARVVLALLAVVTAHAPVAAVVAPPVAQKVPIERLIVNAEQQLRRAPNDPELHFRLARLHGMAWARGSSYEWAEPASGPTPIPFGYLTLESRVQWSGAERVSLDRAIAHYRAGLAIEPDLAARLGLAYCLAQAGDPKARDEARRLLRAVGNDAWKVERTKQYWGPDEMGLAWEAAGYLLQLLDPRTDAREIRELRSRRGAIQGRPRAITPVAVPLAAGLALADIVSHDSATCFDFAGSGVPQRRGWIRPQAAWLVWDPRGTGRVESGLWLFGTFSFFLFWDHGYDALAALDDDTDGWLRGTELAGLALWRDIDEDGVSDAGEVTAIEQTAIRAIATRSERLGTDAWWAPGGLMLADGSVRPTWDVVFPSKGLDCVPATSVQVSPQ